MITAKDVAKNEEAVERAYPIDDNNRVVIYKFMKRDGTNEFVVSRQIRMWHDEPVLENPTFNTINDADDHVVVKEMKNFVNERNTFVGLALSEEDKRLYGIKE